MFGYVGKNIYLCTLTDIKYINSMSKNLKNIKKNSYVIFAVGALLASLTLQVIWVINSYRDTTNRISHDIDNIMVNALMDEISQRSEEIPDLTQIEIPEEASDDHSTYYNYQYLNDGITKIVHKDINIDSLVKYIDIRKAEKFDYDYILYRMYKNGASKILYKSKHQPDIILTSIKSGEIPVKGNYSEYMQIEFLNPYNIFIKEMGLIIISSFILSLLLIWCIIKQLSIIRIQRKTMQMRKDFTYAMVHDMKTPLSTITLGVNGLENEKVFGNLELRNKYMRILKDEAQHLFALVNKILTISKLEEGRLEMHRENVELVPMVDNLEEKFSAKAAKDIRFTNRIETDTVFADAEYLGEALSNLIDNAIKYSRQNVDTEIEIGSRDTGNGVEISVRDNGLGISAKDQKVIFDKFERASASGRTFKNNGPAGFGLGLNYVLQVIEAHGGIVGVDSEVGEYTTFTILLPYGKDEDGDFH